MACVLSLLGKSPYYGEVNIADEELNVLPYTQHSWPISEIHSVIPTTVTKNNSLYGHFRGSVTLTPVTERITVGLSLPALTSWICRNRTLHLLNNIRGSKYLNKRNYCQIDLYSKLIPYQWTGISVWLNFFLSFYYFYLTYNFKQLILWIARNKHENEKLNLPKRVRKDNQLDYTDYNIMLFCPWISHLICRQTLNHFVTGLWCSLIITVITSHSWKKTYICVEAVNGLVLK